MQARARPAYPVFFSYAHVKEGGFGVNPNQRFHRAFKDIKTMLYHLTSFSEDVAFADVNMRTGDSFAEVLFERLAQFRVFVPLLSIGYFDSVWCGREWAAFNKRCENLKTYPPIVPILWNGLNDLSLPKWFTEKHLFDDPTHDSLYREHGLFGLQALFENEYNATIYDLARRIGQVSNSTELPHGDPDELTRLPPYFGGSGGDA